MAKNEPVSLLTEAEVAAMLAAMRQLEPIGFRIGVPQFARDPSQSNAVFKLGYEIRPTGIMSIVCSVILEKHYQGPKVKTRVVVDEYTGSAAGRSELVVEIDEARGYFLSSKIGNAASSRLKQACQTINIDRLAVTNLCKVERAYGVMILNVISNLQFSVIGNVT